MRILSPDMRKPGRLIVQKTEAHIKKYHTDKKVTKMQNSEFAEDTERYFGQLRWYEIIRSSLEEWRKDYPQDAKVIADVLGIGDRVRPATATQTAAINHYSESTVYKLRQAFILEVSYKAIKEGLLTI